MPGSVYVLYMAQDSIVCLVNDKAEEGYVPEHGLSFYLDCDGKHMLFDTGQSDKTLLSNTGHAGIDLHELDAIILSHGHNDHTGGLLAVLQMNPGIRLIVHPSAFNEKFARKKEGLKNIGIPYSLNDLLPYCEIVDATGPIELGHIRTTGSIDRVTLFEEPQQDLLYKWRGAAFTDPLKDDQSLVVESNARLILLCGCCHAGIVNTLEQVKRQHGRYPDIIAGGLHLEKARPEQITRSAEAIRNAGVSHVIAGHCSGDDIVESLRANNVSTTHLLAGMHVI